MKFLRFTTFCNFLSSKKVWCNQFSFFLTSHHINLPEELTQLQNRTLQVPKHGKDAHIPGHTGLPSLQSRKHHKSKTCLCRENFQIYSYKVEINRIFLISQTQKACERRSPSMFSTQISWYLSTSQNQSKVITFKPAWKQIFSQGLGIVEDHQQKEVVGKRMLKWVGNVS